MMTRSLLVAATVAGLAAGAATLSISGAETHPALEAAAAPAPAAPAWAPRTSSR